MGISIAQFYLVKSLEDLRVTLEQLAKASN
jgi:hypothetical protein